MERQRVLARVAVVLVALALVISLVSCAQPAASPTAAPAPTAAAAPTTAAPPPASTSKESVKVALLTYRTGAPKSLGDEAVASFKMAVDYFNAKGGILGGRKIEWKDFDEGLDGQTSVASAKEAMAWGAKIVIGGQEAGTAEPMQAAVNQAGVLFFGTTSASLRQRMELRRTGNFFIEAPGGAYIYGFTRWVQSHPEYKTFAHVSWDDTFDKDIEDAMFHKAFDAPGSSVKMFPTIFSPVGQTDLTTSLVKAVALKPDMLFLGVFGRDATLPAVAKLKELGYTGTVVPLDFGQDLAAESGKQLGDYWTKMPIVFRDFYVYDPSVPENKAYGDAYKALTNKEPGYHGVAAYEAAMITLQAFDIMGSDAVDKMDGAAFDKAVRSVKWVSPHGVAVKFDDKGQMDNAGCWVMSKFDGSKTPARMVPWEKLDIQLADYYKQ